MPLETGQDYYNYYSSMMPWGNQGTGTTAPGTGLTQLATPGIKYPSQGGGGGGFQLPQNYYKAPTYGGIQGVPDQIGISATGLPQTNQAQNFFQNLNFPGKQFLGAGLNKLKMGLGSVASLIGGALPTMSPEAAANQRWAVDGAGYGQGTQRDQFGNLVGQSLMDPSRTYEDRLGEREDELADIIESQKLRGTWKKTGIQQRELDHINLVNEIKEQERIAKEVAEANRIKPQHHGDISQGGGHQAPNIRSISDEGPGVTASSGMHGGKHYARGGILGAF